MSCERVQGRPACRIQAQTRSAGYLLPERWISVEAIGYLTYATLSGRRRLRQYVLAALLIAILTGLLFIGSKLQTPAVASHALALLPITPVPVTQIPAHLTASPAPALLAPTVEPAAKACPDDSRQ